LNVQDIEESLRSHPRAARLARGARNRVWSLCAAVLAGGLFGLIPLWFACYDFRDVMFASYFAHPLVILLNLLPPALLCLLLYLICNRVWAAGLITAELCILLGFLNYYKVAFRDEPLDFEDLRLFREATDMAGRGYDLFLTPTMLAAVLLAALGVVLLKFLAAGRQMPRHRAGGAAALLLIGIALSALYTDQDIFDDKTKNEEHIRNWVRTEVSYSKGLVYPFLHSAGRVYFPKPKNYGQAEPEHWLSEYQDTPIPENQKVDVIAFMLEAYADFTPLGVPGLNPDVYAPLNRLREESIHGFLVTNIFSGGTIDTEQAFLSGYAKLPSFRVATNAYPWYFRQNGYVTEGAHSSSNWFYNRVITSTSLGFDHYAFLEDPEVGSSALDRDFIPRLLKNYQDATARDDTPRFIYTLTYQGHGPYDDDVLWFGDDHVTGEYDSATWHILNNYFGSVQDTGLQLEAFVDGLRGSDRPAVFVAFGDHKPWLGDNAALYYALGLPVDRDTPEGFVNYYSTPYFIWANDAAKAVLERDFTGEGKTIAPCFLMNEVFDACGWTGPSYMQAAREVEAAVPVPTTLGVYFTADGAMTTEEPEIVSAFWDLQYYMQQNFLFDS
jgi:hypothetical protein